MCSTNQKVVHLWLTQIKGLRANQIFPKWFLHPTRTTFQKDQTGSSQRASYHAKLILHLMSMYGFTFILHHYYSCFGINLFKRNKQFCDYFTKFYVRILCCSREKVECRGLRMKGKEMSLLSQDLTKHSGTKKLKQECSKSRLGFNLLFSPL